MTQSTAARPVATPSARVVHFMRIDRSARGYWHRLEASASGNRRLVEFLRIARGRTA